MAESLILLNVATRNDKPVGVNQGFDFLDIISPIRYNSGKGVSYFTSRQLRGMETNSRNLGQTVYEVNHNLATIDAMATEFVTMTVIRRREDDTLNENMIFIASKIMEQLVSTTGGGTKFFYMEEGDPRPVEYEVSDSLASIISSVAPPAAAFNNGLTQTGALVQWGGPLVQPTNIDLDSFLLSYTSSNGAYTTSFERQYDHITNSIDDGSGNIYAFNAEPAIGEAVQILTDNSGGFPMELVVGTRTGTIHSELSYNDLTTLNSSSFFAGNPATEGTYMSVVDGLFLMDAGINSVDGFYITIPGSATDYLNVRADGAFDFHNGNGTNSTIAIHQRSFAFTTVVDMYNFNYGMLGFRFTDDGVTGHISLANAAFDIHSYDGTIRMGGVSPGGTVRLDIIPIAAGDTVYIRAFGSSGGTILGDDGAGNPWIYLQDSSATTTVRITSAGNSFINGGRLGIGTGAPDASAILDLTSTTDGFLMPRMTTAQKNAVVAPVESLLVYDDDLNDFDYYDGANWQSVGKYEAIGIPVTDETTAIAVGAGQMTFHIPFNMKLSEVYAGLTTPQAADGGGGIFTVDIKEAGVSILSTLITIDNTEETSLTATTPPVISDVDLAKGAKITFDVTQIGDGSAAGLKVYLIGRRIS